MTAQALSAVTLETLENMRLAAMTTARATIAGGRRLAGAFESAYGQYVLPSAVRLAPAVGTRMEQWQLSVQGLVNKGLDNAELGSDRMAEAGRAALVRQIERATELASGIGNPLVANTIDTAARMSLPAAKVGLQVSGRAVRGAQKLLAAIGGDTAKATVRRSVRRARAQVTEAAEAVKTAPRRAAARARTGVKSVKASEPAKAVAKRVRSVRKAAAAA
jgi:hypothetical protein